MRTTAFILTLLSGIVQADEAAIPVAVSVTDYAYLLERPPFRRVLNLSQALSLSGVASLPGGKVVTVWNRSTGQSFVVSSTPNPQGWKLVELTESTDLRSVSATIAAGQETLTLRFDPERLTPPKLDNTSKPAPRAEGAVVVEALLRSLHPASAREFEALPAAGQETFRKNFSEFLATYPTATDSTRLAFVHRNLEEVKAEEETAEAREPAKEPAEPIKNPVSPNQTK